MRVRPIIAVTWFALCISSVCGENWPQWRGPSLDGVSRETNLPKWRELLITFRRLEDRGELRGGRFVSGFLGEQLALPVAVESIRAMRNQAPTGEQITISAADPLNLVGIIVPGERVAANSGKVVAFRDGVAVEADPHANVISMPLATKSPTLSPGFCRLPCLTRSSCTPLITSALIMFNPP